MISIKYYHIRPYTNHLLIRVCNIDFKKTECNVTDFPPIKAFPLVTTILLTSYSTVYLYLYNIIMLLSFFFHKHFTGWLDWWKPINWRSSKCIDYVIFHFRVPIATYYIVWWQIIDGVTKIPRRWSQLWWWE